MEKFSTLSVAVAVKDNLAKEILERIFNLPDDSKVVCVIFPPEFIDAVQVEIKKITDKKIVFLCPPKTPSVFEKKTENKAKSRWIRKNGKIFEINTETGEYELCA